MEKTEINTEGGAKPHKRLVSQRMNEGRSNSVKRNSRYKLY